MAKKPRKNSTAQNRWETALMQCPFDEDSWKVNVQFVMESDVLDESHINALANVVKIPQRRKFSHLKKSDLMEMVSELGNPKNKKPPKVPQYFEITEIIYGLQNADQEVPLPLWAKLIKFGLMNIKDEDIRKKESEVKVKDEKGKGSAKKRARSKSPGKKGKKTPEHHAPKKDWSTLRKRGEEDVESKFIDDEPDDGPQHYILVSGFKKPQLLVILSELGVHVNGVIRIQSESYETLRTMDTDKTAGYDEEALAQAVTQRENDAKELELFWKLLPHILQKAPPSSRLQDLGLHEYTVRDVLYPADWENQDNMVGYGTAIFEDIACKIYDSLDWERQYLNYLKNLNLLHIPEFGKEEKPPVEERATPQPTTTLSASPGKREKQKSVDIQTLAVEEMVPPITPPSQVSVDMRYYNDLMNSVPMESISVNLILHGIVEQVIATEEDKIPPNEKEQPGRADGIHLALADCIVESLEGLYLSEEDEQLLSNDFPQLKTRKDQFLAKNKIPEGPVLLNFGDDVSVRTHHLKTYDDFSPKHSEIKLLRRMLSARLFESCKLPAQVISERTARLHELRRFTTTPGNSVESLDVISSGDVDRALQQFTFESMSVSEVDESGFVQKSASLSENSWDDPYTYAAKRAISYSSVEQKESVEKGGIEVSEKSFAEKFSRSVEEVSEKFSPVKTVSEIVSEVKTSGKSSDEKFSRSSEEYFDIKRILDNYTYTEIFKTVVLLQILEEARQSFPCMDTYYSKRDNATFVMFHYPMSPNLRCAARWSSRLHSDVGFRNYLEFVAGGISDWTKIEEQRRQAEVLAKELEKVKAAQDAQSAAENQPTPPPTGKRPKSSKSPKKGSRKGSPSRSSSKAGSTDDNQFSSPFIRAGSIKAENEIQAKAKEEEEKPKKDKPTKSSKKSADKGKAPKSASSKSPAEPKSPKSAKRPGSSKRPGSGKRSPKQRSRSSSKEVGADDAKEVESTKSKALDLPFTGYDVGNNLIHIHGDAAYLYPCDGATIKMEKIRYELGQTSVKVTMYKDGHIFILHIMEPMDFKADNEFRELFLSAQAPKKAPENSGKSETADAEKNGAEKENDGERTQLSSPELLNGKKETDEEYYSLFSSWCATLCDGMTLSLSNNGPEGISTAAAKAKEKLLKIFGEIPPASTPTPAPPGVETPKKSGKKSPKGNRSPKNKSPRSKSPKGKKGKDAEKDAEAQRQEEIKLQLELERKLMETREAEEQERRRRKKPDFQQLYTSCPDGLTIRYGLDPTSAVSKPDLEKDEYRLMVKQSYPYKTSGRQETEKARSKPAMEEVSRVILTDGRVIKVMKDGSTKVLYSDGTVCYNAGSGPIVTEQRGALPSPHSIRSNASNPQQQQQALSDEQRTTTSAGSKKGSKGRRSSAKTLIEATVTEPSTAGTLGVGAAAGLDADAGARSEADQEKAASWLTTYMNGEVTLSKPNGNVVFQDPLLCFTATDPVTGEVMYTRDDKVVRVDRPDSSSVCDHTDGTRITRYCREDESEEQGESNSATLTWYVRVECPGFATVTFNLTNSSCVTTFGSGSTLSTHVDGSYQFLHWNGGRLDMSNDGTVMYTPRPNNDLLIAALSNAADEEEDKKGDVEDNQLKPQPHLESVGSYLMRHNADVCCEALDQEGNVFQVKTNGEVSVINSNMGGEEGEAMEAKITRITPLEHHPPRLFIIHKDGTGTELLRYKDVQEYIGDAQLDPLTAVIREPLPDDLQVTGITVMRPHFGNSGDAWVMQKEESDIIPRNLKTRDLTNVPPQEMKTPGPPFATTVGKGLAIGSAPPPIAPPPAPMCPSALELRQLLQHQPISQDLRRHVAKKLMEYGRAVCEQESAREAMQMQEPRTTEEQIKARDLLRLVLEFDEEGTPRSPDVVPTPSAVGKQGISSNKFPTVIPDQQNSPIVKAKYEASVAPPPLPVVPPPRAKLTQADWDRLRRGIEEEKLGRLALKNRDVPAYFESEEGKAWLLTQAPDMKSASMQLSTDPRSDGSEARMYGSNSYFDDTATFSVEDTRRNYTDDSRRVYIGVSHSTFTDESRPSITSLPQDMSSDSSLPLRATGVSVSDTLSKVRPTNPTPAHASGAGTPTKVRPDNPTPITAGAQQRNARPSNPTPSHASGSSSKVDSGILQMNQQYQPSPIPENPSSAQQREDRISSLQKVVNTGSLETADLCNTNSVLPLETEPSDLLLTKSLLYDVTGQPRKDRVKLPTSILSDKPGAVPNEKFLKVEDSVRRKVRTSSVAGGLLHGNERVADRGFQLLPPEVIFGVLREGTTYAFTVRMRNVGIDLCRFKIKQPPPGTGLRVHYSPGPVAAGMESKLDIEIYAIAVGVEGISGVGTINHQLEIVTETDIIRLPITAVVLPAHSYDRRTETMPPGGKASGVRVCSDRPPSRDAIVRPRKIT